MASVDLPRSLQDYFAFAETAPTRNGRRFSITLPYLRPDGRMDRLQWWYHLSPAKEMALGDQAGEMTRAEAVERFITHIERWLHNTRQDMFGDGAIPHVAAEGNRVVAAYQMDPATSVDVPQCSEDSPDAVDTQIVAAAPDATDFQESTDTATSSDGPPQLHSKSAFG